MKPNILLIDTDPPFLEMMKRKFENTFHFMHNKSSLDLEKIELVVLNFNLQKLHEGIDYLKNLRLKSSVPVVALIPENNLSLIMEILDLGFTEYLAKPFSVEDFFMRLQVSLKRHKSGESDNSVLKFKHIEINLKTRIVKKDGEEIHLTVTEYALFNYLIKNQGRVVDNEQIIKAVWGTVMSANSNYVRVYMRHLRQKLEKNPENPEIFLTEVGSGYRLNQA